MNVYIGILAVFDIIADTSRFIPCIRFTVVIRCPRIHTFINIASSCTNINIRCAIIIIITTICWNGNGRKIIIPLIHNALFSAGIADGSCTLSLGLVGSEVLCSVKGSRNKSGQCKYIDKK